MKLVIILAWIMIFTQVNRCASYRLTDLVGFVLSVQTGMEERLQLRQEKMESVAQDLWTMAIIQNIGLRVLSEVLDIITLLLTGMSACQKVSIA